MQHWNSFKSCYLDLHLLKINLSLVQLFFVCPLLKKKPSCIADLQKIVCLPLWIVDWYLLPVHQVKWQLSVQRRIWIQIIIFRFYRSHQDIGSLTECNKVDLFQCVLLGIEAENADGFDVVTTIACDTRDWNTLVVTDGWNILTDTNETRHGTSSGTEYHYHWEWERSWRSWNSNSN